MVFSGERDKARSITEIVVSIPPPPNRRIGVIQWPRKAVPGPTQEFTTVSIRPSDPASTAAWFDRVAGPKGRLLIFVHGYNTRLETAVFPRDALEEILLRAAKDDRVKDITVLAHSIGTYLAMEALRQTAIREGAVPETLAAS